MMGRNWRILAALTWAMVLAPAWALAQWGGELSFALKGDPKTFDPHQVIEEPAAAVRFLTAGTLVRFNRATQKNEPSLAKRFSLSEDGKTVEFELREGLRFSDGSPLTAAAVKASIERVLDPATNAPFANELKAGGKLPTITATKDGRVVVTFAEPLAGALDTFDDLAIVPVEDPGSSKVTAGPFRLGSYAAGSEIVLVRNPQYWQTDRRSGRSLPYLDAVRLKVQPDRRADLLNLERGNVDLVDSIAPNLYLDLQKKDPRAARDAGPATGSEFLWLNQKPTAKVPAYKRKWFESQAFRRAIASAISREDLCKLVYQGLATPAAGPVSPANAFWYREGLRPHAHDLAGAKKRLAGAGFTLRDEKLYGPAGHAVEFSIITNAGNTQRAAMAAILQEDLAKLGIRISVVTLDFGALIERITSTFEYEACLLGFSIIDLDPNDQMNVWLSSAGQHAWNPGQEQPATEWEARIDELMTKQANTLERAERKKLFDEVQQIAWEQAPIIYLVHPNVLTAISPQIRNANAQALFPHTYANIEWMFRADQIARKR